MFVYLTTMSSTESSICSSPEPMDLSGYFSTPSPNTSSSSSSSSLGVRSLSRKRHSNYLMGTARAPFKSRTYGRNLSALYLPLLVLPGERKSIPSPLTALFSKFHLCRRHFLRWYTNCYTESYLMYVRFRYYFSVTEVPRATKLRRLVQKACRYTLIAKTPFRLSVPKVRFLLATLTYIYTHTNMKPYKTYF